MYKLLSYYPYTIRKATTYHIQVHLLQPKISFCTVIYVNLQRYNLLNELFRFFVATRSAKRLSMKKTPTQTHHCCPVVLLICTHHHTTTVIAAVCFFLLLLFPAI